LRYNAEHTKAFNTTKVSNVLTVYKECELITTFLAIHFVQQMHNAFIENYLFVIALLYVSKIIHYLQGGSYIYIRTHTHHTHTHIHTTHTHTHTHIYIYIYTYIYIYIYIYNEEL